MIDSVLEPLGTPQFRAGLEAGLWAAAAACAVALVARRRWLPVAAALFAVAALVALDQAPAVPPVEAGLLVAALLMSLVGVVPFVARWPFFVAMPLAVPASFVAADSWPGRSWTLPVLIGAAAAGGAASIEIDRRLQGVTPALFAMATAGVYLTVPDTEATLVVLGAAALLGLLGWPAGVANLGPCAPALYLVLAWAAASGGIGRDTSIVGAAGCMVAVGAVPLLGWWRRAPSANRRWRRLDRPAFLACHGAAVLVASRLAGLHHDRAMAGLIALGAVLVLAAISPVGRPVAGRKSEVDEIALVERVH